jgi:glycosyltransferase involved in cell wall biosynthesis
MRVLMLGWEFPPFISGGLGTACFGLTKAMSAMGVEILFVLPRPPDKPAHSHVRFLGRKGWRRKGARPRIEFRTIPTTLKPYGNAGFDNPSDATLAAVAALRDARAKAERDAADAPDSEETEKSKAQPAAGHGNIYEGDVVAKAYEYARLVCELAADEDFDLIHAHDWMTFPAAEAVAKLSGKPCVVHVHATEFDRSGESVNPAVYGIEKAGTHAADRVIAVSKLTRDILVNKYAVPAAKIDVVYNAVLYDDRPPRLKPAEFRRDDRTVLFLGRITMQKGPEFFLFTARKLLEVMKNVRFVVAGSGDMMRRMVELSAELGIGHRVSFTGFLRGAEVERAYRMADVYVMPSVSEPFGITPLEAMLRGVPAVISKQSGAAECVRHALKVDFWDTFETANKLAALLRDPVLYREMCVNGAKEARGFNWRIPAKRCVESYRKVLTA